MSEKNNFIYQYLIILFFLFFTLIFNPNNKIFFLHSIIFCFVLFILNRHKIAPALFISFFITSYLPIGKKFIYQILDLSYFSYLKEEYPLGLVEEISLNISDIFFIFILFHLARDVFIKKINIFKLFNKALLFLSVFIIMSIISSIIKSPNFLFSLYKLSFFIKILVIYFYLKVNSKSLSKRNFIDLIIIIAFFQSYLAILQFFNNAPFGKSIESIHNIEIFGKVVDEFYFYYRPTGTFQHANFLGGFLLIAISLIIYNIFYLKTRNFFTLITLIISLITLLITLSRSSFYSLILFLFLIIISERKRISSLVIKLKKINKILICIILFFITIVFSVPLFRLLNIFAAFSSSGGFYTRFNQAIETFKLILLNPIFGVGPGFSVVEAIKINPNGIFSSFPSSVHNFYLLTAVENGLIAFFFFFLFLFFLLKDLLLKEKIISFVLISAIFYGLFQPTIIISELFFLYAIIKKNEKYF
ncbi:MAG: hypothetical protein KatS3mg092_0640 [Patescibacteria group bacterium]|nr:MAG: hypothetical protein KatS3mg092_0640 [Patescibacteria group bacterium]